MVRFVLPSPYEPVDSANGQIRLLVLYPPDNSYKQAHTIRCDLKLVHLSSKPQYEALSYTWGTARENNPDEIRLGSQQFEVRENVFAALRRLRHPKKPRTLWVDAICINQEDLTERAAQVLLIRQIYSQASQVCVWLGELGDAGIVGMQMLQKKAMGTSNTWSKFKMIDRDWGKPMSWGRKVIKGSTALVEKGNVEEEFSLGEVRELLSRPWWRRIWAVQEAVVASKIVLMCGDETVPWESIEKFHQYSVKSRMMQSFGHPIQARYLDLVEGYQDIYDYREKWQALPSEASILDLLYRFRRHDCEDPRDRIFAFLGMAPAAVDMGILPDYESSVTEVYAQFAWKVIAATGLLDILNCKREWRDVGAIAQPGQSYSLLDQSRYYDVDAEITDGPDRKTRRGWARLPEGWERIRQGKTSAFFDHNTGMIHDKSPLQGQPPVAAEYFTKYRTLSPGWTRTWNNVGCPQVQYRPKETDDDETLRRQKEAQQAELSKLPSWVPNWATPTPWDPAPLIDWPKPDKQRFFASGATRCKLSLPESSESLALSGYHLDTISQVAPAWHPPSDTIPPISAKGIEAFQAWESLATAPVLYLDLDNTKQSSDPYTQTSHPELTTSPRYEALLHTLIANPPPPSPSTTTAPENSLETLETVLLTKAFLTCLSVTATLKSEKEKENTPPNPYETNFFEHFKALSATVVGHLLKTDDERTRFFDLARASKSYGEILGRVLKTCSHRRLFVTRGGYLGLAGWDAEVGDEVVVLEGGKTPFSVRRIPITRKEEGGDVKNVEEEDEQDRWQLVGETYVDGIMGGEVLNMGLEGREFRIV
ncbi:Heterokaryon incompatibility protein (HET) domain containing protein [Rhypophila decipiens]